MIELNKIYNADCMTGMLEIPDKSIDMILCDLPYGITDCAWDRRIDMTELWRQYNRIIKDNGAIVLTATFRFAVDLVNANPKYFRYDFIWEKSMSTGFANSHKMPLRKHEQILVFYKKLPVYNPQGLIKLEKPRRCQKRRGNKESIYRMDTLGNEYTQEFTNYPHSVLLFSNGNHNSLHPTQKPLEMFKYLIKTYTNPGGVVLDNCMGSGTTAIAALETGRFFIGFEKDERYFGTACKRICEMLPREA